MRSFLKAVALAAAFLGVAVNAEAASVALLTGPLEPSQTLPILNNLIVSMNTAFGSSGAGNIGVGLNVPAVANAINAVSLTASAASGTTIIGVGNSAGQTADTNAPLAVQAAGTGALLLGGATTTLAGLQIAQTASRVNDLILTPSATGVVETMVLGGAGADANGVLAIASNGAGALLLGGTTTTLAGVQIAQTASRVNDILVTPSATGSVPFIASGGAGSDSNIGLGIGVVGTGTVSVGGSTAANSSLKVTTAASQVDQVNVAGGAAGSPGVVTVSAVGTDTNISLTLTAKGTGSIVPTSGISAASQNAVVQTVSPRLIGACGQSGLNATTATANAAATDVYVSEIFVPADISTTGVAVLNGTTANGNNNIYLADVAGNQVAHTAATAVSGTSVYQLIAWVGGPIAVNGPGTYYLYFTNSGTSNTWETINTGSCGTSLTTGATNGTFKVLTPPTTFTTAQGPSGSLY